MKDKISFMSGLFDTAPSVPPVANDHHFGEDLARWLAGKSMGSEFVFGAPVRSATGWAEQVTASGESFIVGCALTEGVGSDYAEWLITIDKPNSWRTLGASGSSSRGRLCDHIHNVLRDERQIREVQWD